MEIFNEVTNIILVYHMLTFTDWVADPITRYSLGFSVILVVFANVTVHFTFLIQSSIYKVKLSCKKKLAAKKRAELAKKNGQKGKGVDPEEDWLNSEE